MSAPSIDPFKGRVAARSYATTTEIRYAICDGAKIVGQATVSAADHEAFRAALRAAKIRIGGTWAGSGFVWVFDDRGYSIWRQDGEATITGTRSDLANVVAVSTYVGDDYVERAVNVTRKGGEMNTLVAEQNVHASADPSYTASDFIASNARWIQCCARDLATWLTVVFEDEAFGDDA